MKAAKAADDKAGAAGDLADSKRRIFYSDTTPTEPFDKGDYGLNELAIKLRLGFIMELIGLNLMIKL